MKSTIPLHSPTSLIQEKTNKVSTMITERLTASSICEDPSTSSFYLSLEIKNGMPQSNGDINKRLVACNL